MLLISDFSKLTHVSVRMLRYYDTQGLLKPALIDDINGYRMYSSEQVPKLQKIIMLRDLNFSIAEIKDLVNNWTNENIENAMIKKTDELRALINETNAQIAGINAALDNMKKDKLDQFYNVTVKSIPSYPVISLRRRVSDHFKEGMLWGELMEYIASHHIAIEHSSNNNMAIYHEEAFLDDQVDIEVCIFVKQLGKDDGDIRYRMTEEVNTMASMMVYGAYTNIAAAYASFVNWLGENEDYSMTSPSRQISIIGEANSNNPDEYLTEIQIPLLKASK